MKIEIQISASRDNSRLFETEPGKLEAQWFGEADSTHPELNPDYHLTEETVILTSGYCETEAEALKEIRDLVKFWYPQAIIKEM